MAGLLPSLPGPARLLRQPRSLRIASANQQAPSAPTKRALTWGAGEDRPDSSGPPLSAPDQQLTAASPMDVVVEDLRFLQAKTGLDLITPLQEVKEVHDQMVAVLNPIAGEKMQVDLEDRIASLQGELQKAHSQVHLSEERLDSTIEELTRLEMAAHGFTAALSFAVADRAPSSFPEAAPQEEVAMAVGTPAMQRSAASTRSSSSERSSGSSSGTSDKEQRSTLEQLSTAPQYARQQISSSMDTNERPQQRHQRAKQPPESSRSEQRGAGRQLHSDLDLPEQLREFWYPVAFSSQLGAKPGVGGRAAAGKELLALELFGQPWVLFRDAQGLPACVLDACAHRACPLSLGSVVDGCIQCPYHGWQYDGAGACTRMPSTAFCRGISVSTLPVAESDGFVWVWPGRRLPPRLGPEPTRPPEDFTVHAELTLEVPVEHGLLLENLLDLAHAPFTHTSTFAKGWPVPDVVRFNAARLLGGNWEPYPIDMAFEPPCMVLSTIGLAQPGKIMRGQRAAACRNHLHQLHVCLPAGPGRTRLLYRMSMDFLGWTRWVPGIQAFWAYIAQQVMGEDLVLVAGQQDRMLRGADVWAHPVAYDKLGVRYRRWRNSLVSSDPQERAEIESELRPMSAGELFSIPKEGCELGDGCDVGDLLSA